MTEDDKLSELYAVVGELLKTPEGVAVLSKMMDESDVTPEDMRRWADEKAAETGKSMNDIVIEIIRSGELDDARMAECMEMVEGMSSTVV